MLQFVSFRLKQEANLRKTSILAASWKLNRPFKMARSLSLLLLATAVHQHAVAQNLPPVPPLQPWPLAGEAAAAFAFSQQYTLQQPTGLTKQAYLDTIHSVVGYWRTQQAVNGSIIDPATGYEMQYSTPCFAWASALLVQEGVDATLLDPATRALTFAIQSMYNGSAFCAQATCDFYALPVMRAFLTLRPLVSPSIVSTWTSMLQGLDPNKTYEFTGQNWELTAAAGEFIRMQQLGWTNSAGNWSLWEGRIARLATLGLGGGFWNPNGQFQDNYNGQEQQAVTSPHAYDAFADGYSTILLDLGYDSPSSPDSYPFRTYLEPLMRDRAPWTHALFQGPWGEIPVGGRSGQHQWNEALMAAQYEMAAVRAWKGGDNASACMFRRAARTSLASIRRWIRPADGALQIVKNWFMDPKQRWGYETYSFFSQYNVLPMAWLANAYVTTASGDNDAIPECSSLADTGGVAFALPYSTFRKVFASAQGTYVEVMTGGDAEYDSTGLYRVHFNGCAVGSGGGSSGQPCATTVGSLMGPSAAPPLSASLPLGVASAIGGVWWSLPGDAPGYRRSLANHTLGTVLASIFTPAPGNSPESVAFTVQYILWAEAVLVTEKYSVQPGLVSVTSSLSLAGPSSLLALLHATAQGKGEVGTVYMPPAKTEEEEAIRASDLPALLRLRPFGTSLPAPLRQTLLEGAAGSSGAGGAFQSFGLQWPAMLYDGRTNYTVSVNPGGCNCSIVDGGASEGAIAYSVQPAPGHAVTWDALTPGLQVPTRNGLITPLYAAIPVASDSPSVSHTITIQRPASQG